MKRVEQVRPVVEPKCYYGVGQPDGRFSLVWWNSATSMICAHPTGASKGNLGKDLSFILEGFATKASFSAKQSLVILGSSLKRAFKIAELLANVIAGCGCPSTLSVSAEYSSIAWRGEKAG